MRTTPLLFALALPLLVACQGTSAEIRADAPAMEDPPPANVPLAKLLDSLALDAKAIRFHVDKSDRKFEVFVGKTLLKTYPCVLGEKPVGDKYMQGDRKTPEGTFTFRSKRVHQDWHKFIWVDYPNDESWRRFKGRQAAGEIPANKDIGGEIGIHGVPVGMDHWIDAGEDWTWGCIALRNADVDEIYTYIVPWKTQMVIDP
jgi:murein L,D-transpeptidase YafK